MLGPRRESAVLLLKERCGHAYTQIYVSRRKACISWHLHKEAGGSAVQASLLEFSLSSGCGLFLSRGKTLPPTWSLSFNLFTLSA